MKKTPKKEIVKKKNPAAVALAKLGAKKGGQARALNLSPERRSEIARQAVLSRWKKAKGVHNEHSTKSA
jgi:hypothetical protein